MDMRSPFKSELQKICSPSPNYRPQKVCLRIHIQPTSRQHLPPDSIVLHLNGLHKYSHAYISDSQETRDFDRAIQPTRQNSKGSRVGDMAENDHSTRSLFPSPQRSRSRSPDYETCQITHLVLGIFKCDGRFETQVLDPVEMSC